MKAQDLDRRFDAGESIAESLDLSTVRHINRDCKRTNVDFPVWMVRALDQEASRLGVPRQSIIKVWIAERLQSRVHQEAPRGV
jgi:hypothetical protein